MSEANRSAALVFDFSPNGKASGTTVTARIGDDVLAVDKFDVTKSKARSGFVDCICKGRPGIQRHHAERILLAEAAEYAKQHSKADEKTPQADGQELLLKMPQHVREEAHAMLESPDLLQRMIDDVAALGVAGERELVASIYMLGVSRLLDKPLAAIVQAPSSVGKSYTVGKVAELFPPEAVIHATAMTPQALFYLEPGSLCHKWIVAGERSRREDDETAEATKALREMISSGKLSKLVPMKEGNRIVTRRIEQEGPIAFIETTTLTRIFDEDANRCLLLSADERTQQTRAILDRLAASYTGGSTVNVDAIVLRHYALQRMIRQLPVVIPFAEKLAESFDVERVEARRGFPHLMSMIQASALLHQFQRQLDGDGRIVAAADDYKLARHLCRVPLARLLGGQISEGALRYYDRLTIWASDLPKFTTTEAVKKDRASDRAIRGWLAELADAGAVKQIAQAKGNQPAEWMLTGMAREELVENGCGLPEPGGHHNMILAPPNSTSDKHFTPIFAEYLSEMGQISDYFRLSHKQPLSDCRNLPEETPTSDKYAGKQDLKPLSEVRTRE